MPWDGQKHSHGIRERVEGKSIDSLVPRYEVVVLTVKAILPSDGERKSRSYIWPPRKVFPLRDNEASEKRKM